MRAKGCAAAWICTLCVGWSLSLGSGCSHELDGPTPQLTPGLTPHLVCNEQLTTRVAVTGSGLSPMPVDTATEPARLLLPTLTLTRSGDLDGVSASGAGVILSGDPLEPNAGLVRWSSQSAMAFDVTPELALDQGIYDLAVDNPNGHAGRAPLGSALAVVPPPVLTEVRPMAICVDQFDVLLELVGQGFLDVDGAQPTVTFTAEGGDLERSYGPTEMLDCAGLPAPATETLRCGGMTVTIPQGDLPVGLYRVVVRNPDPAGCQTTEEISVEVVPPPDVTGVMPRRLCTGGGSVGVLGSGFRPGATVTVGGLDASSVTVTGDGTSAMATFGPGLEPGTHDLTLTNPEGCDDTLADAVDVVEGPILFWVDPPVVYNGIATQITLYGSGLAGGIDSVQIVPSGGGAALTLDSTLDPALGRVQAVVPTGTAAGSYDVVVNTAQCPAVLPAGLRVTDSLTLTLTRIEPPFGWTATSTPVTIFGAGLQQEPRAYLNPQTPTPTTVATPLGSVALLDDVRLTGVVRGGLPAGVYDVIVVNPDGAVGLLDDAFTVAVDPPPVIETVSPGELDAGGVHTIDVTGSGFRMPAASWSCQALDGSMSTPAGTVTASTATSATVTLDTTPLSAGTVCVLRLTNPDGTYGEYSAIAITTPASNIQMFEAATELTTPRRAVALAAGRATSAARYLFAIGGDGGSPATAHDTSESAPVDVFGNIGAWFEQPNRLPEPRTLAAAQRIGRFLYLVGGQDPSGPTTAVHRAEILDPLQAPTATDLSARRGAGSGLGPGIWYYRVAAVFPATDPTNPGGESLPSDPLIVNLPTGLPDTLLLTVYWTEVPGASGYRVYRTPSADLRSGDELLLAELPAGTTQLEDDGRAPMAGLRALPAGAHGTWMPMPPLGTARAALGLGHAVDPADPDVHYLYAIGGRGAGGAPLGTYELLTVTVSGPRAHSVAAAWTPGASLLGLARSELGIYSVDHFAALRVPDGTTFVYAVGGIGPGGTAVSDAEVAELQPGGQLGPWLVTDAARSRAGFAAIGANNFLYMFGGGPSAVDQCISAEICGAGLDCRMDLPDPPDLRNWNAEGISLNVARYLPGGTTESAFIFVVGGAGADGVALQSTEQTVL